MKKIAMLLAILSFGATAARAQDWKEALTKAASSVVDKVTDGKLTQYAIVGSWSYTGPGMKFEGGDLASDLGGSAIETTITPKLEKAYQLAGIKPGACSFVFEQEGAFMATFGTRQLSGTYEFDASTHIITLHFAKGSHNLGSVSGHAYISGTHLQLVFPVTKLVDIVTAVSSKISTLSSVATLLKKYENVYLGFEFEK